MNHHKIVPLFVVLLLIGIAVGPLAAQDDPAPAPDLAAAWNPTNPDIVAVLLSSGIAPTELRLLDRAGTVISTTPLEGAGVIGAPLWNYDGTYLAIPIRTPAGYDVALFDVTDPTAPTRLDFSVPRDQLPVFSWPSILGLAVANAGQIEYWSFWDGLQLNPLEYTIQVGNQPPAIEAMAYSPDSVYVAVAHPDEIALWFVSEGGNFGLTGRIPKLTPDAPTSATLAWSPDSRRFAVGDLYSLDIYTVDFLNPPTLEVSLAGIEGKRVVRLQWSTNRLAAVFLSNDDTSPTATVQVWNTTTWATLLTQDIPLSQINVVSLAGTGDQLLTGVDPVANTLAIAAVIVPGTPAIYTTNGDRVGATTAINSCANGEARITIELEPAVASTPHDLSLVIRADYSVYLSQRITFTTPATVGARQPFGLSYFYPTTTGDVPRVSATIEAGDDLPAETEWTFQFRNTETGGCATVRIAVACESGMATIIENSGACLFE